MSLVRCQVSCPCRLLKGQSQLFNKTLHICNQCQPLSSPVFEINITILRGVLSLDGKVYPFGGNGISAKEKIISEVRLREERKPNRLNRATQASF